MTEPTPIHDATVAELSQMGEAAHVTATVATVADVTTDTSTGLDLPAGPDTSALQAFTDAIPDEGHRAIAQALVDAFVVRDQQLQAFLAAYATARADLDAAQAAITELQTQVAALTPAPATT